MPIWSKNASPKILFNKYINHKHTHSGFILWILKGLKKERMTKGKEEREKMQRKRKEGIGRQTHRETGRKQEMSAEAEA